MNILITSIGSTGAQCYIKSLRSTKFKIFGLDKDHLNPFKLKVDEFIVFDFDKESPNSLLEICLRHKISLLIPVLEEELNVISNNIDLFESNGIKVLVSEASVIDIFLDKLKTKEKLNEIGVQTPRSFVYAEIEYPVIAKKIRGTGSRGIFKIYDSDDLDYFMKKYHNRDYFFEQLIEGEEYTVDLFCDKTKKVKSICLRHRTLVRNGLCYRSETINDINEKNNISKIVNQLGLIGPSNFQFIKTKNGEKYFIELNPRIGGTFILSVKAGLPLVSLIEDFIFERVSENYNVANEIYMSRYLEESIFNKNE